MKKIKTILILGVMILIGFVVQSQSITYRFNNYMIISGTPDTLVFDIEAKSSTSTTYATAFSFCVSFNASAFGTGIPVSTQILVLGQPTGYNFNTVPTAAGSGKWNASFTANPLNPPFSGTYNTAFLSNLTTSFQGIARYKMVITGSGALNMGWFLTLMNGQNKYVLTSGGNSATSYTPVLIEGAPVTQTLLLSEIGDPSNTTTNFVELYNPGASAINFSYYPWYLNTGTSTVTLTGSIAAGGKYTVAYNNTDFTPSLVSTTVGTGGTSLYRLSYFGNYSAGTIVDVYDGNATGFAFTGKHAVRHYNVVLPNLTLTASEWVISAAQKDDMTPGSHHSTLNWDGVPTSDWRTKANWGEGFIPDAGHNVAITNVGASPIISNGDNAYCHDLAIASGANLTIESLPGSDGSLITYGTVTGNATVQRYIGANRYWYVSQPVTSATANVFLHMWLFTYTGGAWTPFIYNPATPLNLMQGYAVWSSSINSYDPPNPPLGTTTTSYTGVLNTGNISTSLINDWNFVGNPYASAMDWNATGWTKTGITTNTFYVWNGSTYASYNGSGGTNGGTQYIPAAQGFFVNSTGAGTLGVTNDVRTHSTQAFWKSEETMLNRLSMTVSNGEITDETVVYFNEEATTELDYKFDAQKFMAPGSPQAYTMMASEKMAINAVNNTAETPTVVLGINAPEAGQYTITASNLESFDAGTPVLLEDILTGQKIDLREMNTYSFYANEGSFERFVIHFALYQGLGDNDNSEVNGIYAVNRNVYVDFKGVNGEIAIYNILGEEISRTTANSGMNMIPVSQGNAVYIVKVISNNTTVTKKVFVK